MADNKRIVYTIEVNDKGKMKIENLTKGFTNANIAVNKLNADLLTQGEIMENNSKKNQNMIDKTGLAGATLVELSRTISDSNYGMRAMANNITQLSTLMITLFATSGGLVGGFKQLAKALFGPLGLILGFSILVREMEANEIAAGKITNSANAMADAIGKAGSDLVTFLKVVERGNISEEEMALTVEQLNENYKDLNIQLDEEGKLTEASRLQIEQKVDSLKALAKAQAIQLELQKIYQEEINAEIKKEEDLANVGERKWYQTVADNLEFYGRKISPIFREIDKISGIDKLSREEYFDLGKEMRIKDINEEYKTNVEKRQNRISELLKTLEDEDLLNEAFGNKEEKDELARLERLRKLRDKYIEDAKIDDRLHKDEQLQQEKQLVLDQAEIDGAGKELLLAIEEDFNQRIEAARQARRDKEARERERDLMRNIRYANELIRIEQNRLKAEQEIQSQRIGFAQQVAGILSTIAKEGTALAKVALAVEKGAAIADVIVKAQQSIATQTAANQAANMQATAAYASIPFVGSLKATIEIAKNNALLAKGIAATKLSAGLSIAQILATSLTSGGKGIQAPSTGSTPVAAPQIQAPAFNVVGATQTSQLAQTISQAEQQPIKAFVVASDVSTAQELERSTIEGASIG